MVTPAKPEALKRSRPASRMRSRVAFPVWLIAGYYSMTDRIFQNFDSGQRSANILRDAGHTVNCPTLRGNRPEDDRSKLGLEDAISSVLEFIEERDLTDIRLVGHSYAGMVISGVADRLRKPP